MTDALKQLSEAGVAIWLDDLSRERLVDRRAGRADPRQPRRRRHDQPDDLPEGDQRQRALRRPGPRPRDRAASTSTRRCAPSPRIDVREACDVLRAGVRRERRRRRPGLDRGRPRGSRTTPRRRSPRLVRCGGWSTGRTCSSRSRRPRRACPRSSRSLAEGISVNVTLIFSLERYGEVIDAFMTGSSGPASPATTCRRSARSRPSSSPGSTPRSTPGWTRSAATRPRRCAARRRSPTPASPSSSTRRSSTRDRWRALLEAPARSRSVRCGRRPRPRTRRTTTRCTSSSWSRTAPSTRCPSRPSTRSPTTARSPATRSGRTTPTPQGVLDALKAKSASTTTTSCRCSKTRASRSSTRRGHELTESTKSELERLAAGQVSDARQRVSAGGVTVRFAGADVVAARDAALAGQPGRRGARSSRKDAGLVGPGRRGRGRRSGSAGWTARPSPDRSWPRSSSSAPSCARAGVDHVVLAGHGRLLPRTRGDRGDVRRRAHHPRHHRPGPGRRRAGDRLESTVLVVSSKSGGTLETDSHRRAFEEAFRAAGIDPAERIVVVTDPGSPLHRHRDRGRLSGVRGRPQRRRPLQRADAHSGWCRPGWPAYRSASCSTRPRPLAATLCRRLRQPGARPRRRTRRLRRRRARQGRDRRRRLRHRRLRRLGRAADRRVDRQERPRPAAGRRRHARLPRLRGDRGHPPRDARRPRRRRPARRSSGPLGAQFLLWEFATAVAGKVHRRSTRSTSRTSRSRRTTPRPCSTRPATAPLPTGEPRVRRRRRSRSTATPTCSAARPTSPACSTPSCGAIPDHGLPRGHGLPRPAQTTPRRPTFATRSRSGSPHPVTFGWGAALPALDRPVPQGRPTGRRVPADHRRQSPSTSRCPASRSPSAGCSWPRRSVTCRRCTSRSPPRRTAPSHRPRRRYRRSSSTAATGG